MRWTSQQLLGYDVVCPDESGVLDGSGGVPGQGIYGEYRGGMLT